MAGVAVTPSAAAQGFLVTTDAEGVACLNAAQLAAGVALVALDSPEAGSSSHVVATHRGTEAFQWAAAHHKPAVSYLWLYDTLQARALHDLTEQLYQPFPAQAIPGTKGIQVTITGITGPLRHVVLQLLASMGLQVEKNMCVGTITYVVVRDVHEQSNKLNAIHNLPEGIDRDRIKIVNLMWVYDCLRQSQLLPADAYLDNLPPEVDPCNGVPAADAHLPGQMQDLVPDSPDQDAAPAAAVLQRSMPTITPRTLIATSRKQQQQHSNPLALTSSASPWVAPSTSSLARGSLDADAALDEQVQAAHAATDDLVNQLTTASDPASSTALEPGRSASRGTTQKGRKVAAEDEAAHAVEEQAVLASAAADADADAPEEHEEDGDVPAAGTAGVALGVTPSRGRLVARASMRPVVALSNMHTDERGRCTDIIRSLGVSCTPSGRWEMGVSHLVLPKLVRNVQVLAAMACGCWVLSWSYLTACERYHQWVEPDEHELQEGVGGCVSPGVPRHWRLRLQEMGTRAFHGLVVVILGVLADKHEHPDNKDIRNIIIAGGGTVIASARVLHTHIDFAVVRSGASRSDVGVQKLLKAKVPCVTREYVIDWLAHPWNELGDHVLFGGKVEGALLAAQKARAVSPEEEVPEPSTDWGAI
ncbi:hypothetical protein WJX73_007693 [Symbiochloris irregularis]|uniref:BRCT domain-containing protein n=1 Tax=Symbiochloris irregularis TaxID=706552 RepID=A0AAW1PN98_9CHLO